MLCLSPGFGYSRSAGEGSGNNYAYLVTDEKSTDAVIIDPANPSEYGAVVSEMPDRR